MFTAQRAYYGFKDVYPNKKGLGVEGLTIPDRLKKPDDYTVDKNSGTYNNASDGKRVIITFVIIIGLVLFLGKKGKWWKIG